MSVYVYGTSRADLDSAEIQDSPIAKKLFVNITSWEELNNRPRTILDQAPGADVVQQDPRNWLEMQNTLGPGRSIELTHKVHNIFLKGQGSRTVDTEVGAWAVSYTLRADAADQSLSLSGRATEFRDGKFLVFAFETKSIFLLPGKDGKDVVRSKPGQDTLQGSASIERILQNDGTYDVNIKIHALPEPESYAMAMGGLGVGWGVWRRWRRRVA